MLELTVVLDGVTIAPGTFAWGTFEQLSEVAYITFLDIMADHTLVASYSHAYVMEITEIGIRHIVDPVGAFSVAQHSSLDVVADIASLPPGALSFVVTLDGEILVSGTPYTWGSYTLVDGVSATVSFVDILVDHALTIEYHILGV